VSGILDGRQPERMTLPGLMGPFPFRWDKQRKLSPSSPVDILILLRELPSPPLAC
jgi:hypothetical protein